MQRRTLLTLAISLPAAFQASASSVWGEERSKGKHQNSEPGDRLPQRGSFANLDILDLGHPAYSALRFVLERSGTRLYSQHQIERIDKVPLTRYEFGYIAHQALHPLGFVPVEKRRQKAMGRDARLAITPWARALLSEFSTEIAFWERERKEKADAGRTTEAG